MPKRLPRTRTLKGDPKLAHYDSDGGTPSEPPIVLVHGATLRSEDWENIFPRLRTRYRVIAYDARGHGKSGRAGAYGLEGLVGDLLRLLKDIAKAPAIVIGHSLGGATALAAQHQEPERFKGLVLEDPYLSRYHDGQWRVDAWKQLRAALDKRGDPNLFRRAIGQLPLGLPGPRGERTVAETRGFYGADRLVTYYADLDPEFVDALLRPEDVGAATIAGAELKVPTLLLAADPKDSALAEPDIARLGSQGAELMRFPGLGHRIHGLKPEAFLEALEPFLRKVRSS